MPARIVELETGMGNVLLLLSHLKLIRGLGLEWMALDDDVPNLNATRKQSYAADLREFVSVENHLCRFPAHVRARCPR